MPRAQTLTEVLIDFKKVHGDTYDYSKVIYLGSTKKIIIICPLHGEFTQIPSAHKRGDNCPTCGHISTSVKSKSSKVLSQTQCILDFEDTHGSKYDYSNVVFIDTKTNVDIICKEHGVFNQLPYAHKLGKGCPSCAKSGFKNDKPAILYYLKIEKDNQVVYKIGITNLSVKERFWGEMEFITVINTEHFEIGKKAYDKEQFILKVNIDKKWNGPKILKSGNTEMFIENIFI